MIMMVRKKWNFDRESANPRISDVISIFLVDGKIVQESFLLLVVIAPSVMWKNNVASSRWHHWGRGRGRGGNDRCYVAMKSVSC